MAAGGSRRKFLEIEAADPPTGAVTGTVLVSFERIQYLGKLSMGYSMEIAHCVPEVLQKPTAIYEGLTCDDDEDKRGYGWRCYCGIPSHAYRQDGTPRAAHLEQVFLVFVNDQKIAYAWRWELASVDDPLTPAGADDRFRERLV